MTALRIAVYGALFAILILATNELGYYWWRKLNPGEHWSHLRGDFTPVIAYPPLPRGEGILNNQRRTF